LKSRAVLSVAKNLQVEVVADVINFRTGESQRSNEFYFTFECEGGCPKIMPKSYAESVCYIEGKRRYLKAKK
jgi:acyl-coenzyme A thioesterase 9